MGGAWLTTHLWQHYLYSGDKLFLSEAYPALKGAADFYLDYLIEHPEYGWMVTAPSMSQEHGPSGEDTKQASTIVAGCTMDNQIIFDVLSNALHASIILKMSASYQDSLRSMLKMCIRDRIRTGMLVVPVLVNLSFYYLTLNNTGVLMSLIHI